jgi:hypothetical protein
MGPKKRTLRAKSAEKFGGGPCELPDSDLPTYGDVARYFYLVQQQEADFRTQVDLVEQKLIGLWQKCNPALPLKDSLTLR